MAYYGPRRTEYRRNVGTGKFGISISNRYVQRLPYTDPLPYKISDNQSLEFPNPWGHALTNTSRGIGEIAFADSSQAQAAAYSKFRNACRDTVDLAVNIAERKQSIDMMAARASQLLRFVKNLKQLRFSAAARDLGLRVTRKRDSRQWVRMTVKGPVTLKNPRGDYEMKLKRKLKSFGNNFLEYHFGWSPLLNDIGGAIEMTHAPVYKGQARRVKESASITGSPPSAPTTQVRGQFTTKGAYTKVKVTLGGDVVVSDPNVARLSSMGFVNPLTIAWELVPFSFVADWFTNIGDVLASYTDFAGLTLQRSYTTVYAKNEEMSWYCAGAPNYYSNPMYILPIYGGTGWYVSRSLGISLPTFAIRPIKWPSITRGATAISLLTKALKT